MRGVGSAWARPLLAAALFASVLFLPWFVTLALALALVALANAYEVILAGFLLDLLYGVDGMFGVPMPFLGTTTAFILFAAAYLIKRNLVRNS